MLLLPRSRIQETDMRTFLTVLVLSTTSWAFPLPCYLESPPSCPPPVLVCGDIDFDGGVTCLDALLAAQHSVGVSRLELVQLMVGDVYNSTPSLVVDTMDVLYIAQQAVGLAPIYERGCTYYVLVPVPPGP